MGWLAPRQSTLEVTLILYANGCSMTYGMELCDDAETGACTDDAYREAHAWPGRLAGFLGADEVVNDAVISGSNDRILRTTIQWVLTNIHRLASQPVLVAIGWSGAMRREFYVDAAYRQVIPYQPHPHADTERLLAVYRDVAWHERECGERLLTQIVALQSFLAAHRIPFLFFDAIEGSFDAIGRAGLADSPTVRSIDRRRYFGFGEEHASMAATLERTELPWCGRHPSPEGHDHWAQKLAVAIIENDAIKPSSGPLGPPGDTLPTVRPSRTFTEPRTDFIYD